MARPQKRGLDYFAMDTDIFANRKIWAMCSRFGSEAVAYYVYLLCEIYREHGYYLELDRDFDSVASLKLGISIEKMEQIRAFLLERDMMDARLFESEKVLTSANIQRRYQLAIKTRASKTPVVVRERLWLLGPEETLWFIMPRPDGGSSLAKAALCQE